MMTKILKPMAFCGILSASFFAAGCGEEASVTSTTEVKSPEGTKTITEEKKVETTGDVPATPPVEKPATP